MKLVCRDPLASPREIVLDKFPVELGRGEHSGVRVDDRWLSRRHCELNQIANEIHVRDLGSRHGTFVNGKQVDEAIIRSGDELCIGLSHFTLRCDVDSRAEVAHVHDSSELVLA